MIGYLRVSTKRQGDSGLGLEAQKAAILTHVNGVKVLAWYTEVESGKKSARPELAKALAHARRAKCMLVVAKLDRLSRNVAFLSALLESDVPFVCCDNPHANRLTIHILAAVAEEEARAISQRTRAALAAYKARGGILGGQRPECRNLTPEARVRGQANSVIENKRLAKAACADLIPVIKEMVGSLRQKAAKLNELGHTTRRGKSWTGTQVRRVLLYA